MKVVQKTYKIDSERREINFGIRDNKGRFVGCQIETGIAEFIFSTVPDAVTFYPKILPGKYVWFRPHATRDGRRYGACQVDRYFETTEKMEKAIAKYVEKAKARAIKNFKETD